MKKRVLSLLLALTCAISLPTLAAEPSLAHADMNGVRYIYMEGARMAFLDSSEGIRDPLLYGDTVYIPLWTVGMWAGADVRWDQADMTVTITRAGSAPVYLDVFTLNRMDVARQEGTEQYQADRKNGVEVQLLSDAAVAADGTVRPSSGGTACPLLFRNEVYLPAPYVAELLGKQMLRFSEDIYFYEAPTHEDLLEAEGYLSAVRSRLNSVRTVVKGEAPKTIEEYEAKVKTVQTHLKAVAELSAPAFKGFACFAEQLRNYALLVLSESVDPYLPVEESSGAAEALGLSPMRPVSWNLVKGEDGSVTFQSASSQEPAVDPQKAWTSFSEYMVTLAEGKPGYTTYFLSLEDMCAAGEEFLTAVRTALPDDAFAVDSAAYAYADADRIVYAKAVTVLSQLGVISGKEDGSFDPQGLVTRAECAKLLVALRCGGNPERIPAHEGSDVFSDIRGHWAEDYISYGTKNLGLLTGRGDGTFDPDAPVTGLELAKMALASLGYDPVAYQLTGPNWASQTNRLALMVCDPSLYEELGEDVAVSEPITREVAAQILYNTLFNGVVEVRPNTDPAAGETANTYVPKRDGDGQAVPFYSVYFDAAKWDVLSAK